MKLAMKIRFAQAMAAYVVLGLIATLMLTGKMRYAILLFLAGMAAKTVIAWKRPD